MPFEKMLARKALHARAEKEVPKRDRVARPLNSGAATPARGNPDRRLCSVNSSVCCGIFFPAAVNLRELLSSEYRSSECHEPLGFHCEFWDNPGEQLRCSSPPCRSWE